MTHLCRLKEAQGEDAQEGAQHRTVQPHSDVNAYPLPLTAIVQLLST